MNSRDFPTPPNFWSKIWLSPENFLSPRNFLSVRKILSPEILGRVKTPPDASGRLSYVVKQRENCISAVFRGGVETPPLFDRRLKSFRTVIRFLKPRRGGGKGGAR